MSEKRIYDESSPLGPEEFDKLVSNLKEGLKAQQVRRLEEDYKKCEAVLNKAMEMLRESEKSGGKTAEVASSSDLDRLAVQMTKILSVAAGKSTKEFAQSLAENIRKSRTQERLCPVPKLKTVEYVGRNKSVVPDVALTRSFESLSKVSLETKKLPSTPTIDPEELTFEFEIPDCEYQAMYAFADVRFHGIWSIERFAHSEKELLQLSENVKLKARNESDALRIKELFRRNYLAIKEIMEEK